MLQGRKIKLRTFLDIDITDQHIYWLNDPAVMMFSRHYKKLHTRESCVEYHKSFDNKKNYYFVILDSNQSLAIGSITVYLNSNKSEADIGILIGDVNYWGRGFAKDAILTTIEYLHKLKGIDLITCGTRFDNHRMIKLAESCGMIKSKTEWVDGVQYIILKMAVSQ
jgi:[ribosomal protein S5]-alanine N-acetyltransferase